MGAGSHLGGRVGPEPDAGLLVGLPELADPLVLVPPPHPAVHGVPGLLEHDPPSTLLGAAGGKHDLLIGMRGAGAGAVGVVLLLGCPELIEDFHQGIHGGGYDSVRRLQFWRLR
ncbi:hypothetical protein MLD38_010478 [Melastoma candidum]|uniref:Uncharacterized protein n=1 Tax=Melastoma candidum TaxID=119954 RepID=A0ACB9R328_9MYRT|nr:hypothetical protein MLD38_010478 [Melastoma candidum]